MKRALIGGFFSVIGSIWTLAIMFIAGNNLVDSWPNPPGRFLTTVSAMGLMPLFVIAVMLVVLGIFIMAIELFKKDN